MPNDAGVLLVREFEPKPALTKNGKVPRALVMDGARVRVAVKGRVAEGGLKLELTPDGTVPTPSPADGKLVVEDPGVRLTETV